MKHLFSSKMFFFIRMLSLPGVLLLIAGWQKILEGEKKIRGGCKTIPFCLVSCHPTDMNEECFKDKDINIIE